MKAISVMEYRKSKDGTYKLVETAVAMVYPKVKKIPARIVISTMMKEYHIEGRELKKLHGKLNKLFQTQ